MKNKKSKLIDQLLLLCTKPYEFKIIQMNKLKFNINRVKNSK